MTVNLLLWIIAAVLLGLAALSVPTGRVACGWLGLLVLVVAHLLGSLP